MLMAQRQITKTYERGGAPWPLPNKCTKTICLLAGREASAALCIALGKHPAATIALEAFHYEPFTYWDWHGVSPDDTYARDWKGQRMWEYQRGFVVSGTQAFGYPTPRKRWETFKECVLKIDFECWWVKKIAVAHWMRMKDIEWYVCCHCR
jgi:hypothetical protein